MSRYSQLTTRLSGRMSVVAGCSLIGVMLLTVCDVALRYFGYPIMGVYDLVALGGAVVIGFSIPYAADRKVHVYMEMAGFLMKEGLLKKCLYLLTRLITICLTVIIGYNLYRLGLDFRQTGEASLTIQLVYYPVAFGLSICFFLQTFVYLAQIFSWPATCWMARGATRFSDGW